MRTLAAIDRSYATLRTPLSEIVEIQPIGRYPSLYELSG